MLDLQRAHGRFLKTIDRNSNKKHYCNFSFSGSVSELFSSGELKWDGHKGLDGSGISTWWCVGHIILVDQLDRVKTQFIFSLDTAVGTQYWNTNTLYPFSVHGHLMLWELARIGTHEIVERNLWRQTKKKGGVNRKDGKDEDVYLRRHLPMYYFSSERIGDAAKGPYWKPRLFGCWHSTNCALLDPLRRAIAVPENHALTRLLLVHRTMFAYSKGNSKRDRWEIPLRNEKRDKDTPYSWFLHTHPVSFPPSPIWPSASCHPKTLQFLPSQ